MGVFDDNPFIKVKPGPTASRQATDPAAVAKGESWTLIKRGGDYVVDYVSGELMGRERTLAVSDQEAEEIKAEGDAAIDRVFARHGVG